MLMRNYIHILDGLKLSHLQALAVSLGTQCSGTKTAIKSSIREILPRPDTAYLRRPLSIISIDMGIRNLAYAHLTADVDDNVGLRKREEGRCYRLPRLRVWEKIAIAPSTLTDTSESESDSTALEERSSTLSPDSCRTEAAKTTLQSKIDAFAPDLYAVHAVNLIKRIMALTPTPTHILIERQRFRSGGSPMVQDWSIRIGVFEGMLYAVLRTLAEMKTGSVVGNAKDQAGNPLNVDVEGVLPGRVLRYWAENGGAEETVAGVAKPKGKAMKKFKIDLVGRALEESLHVGADRHPSQSTSLEIDSTAHPTVSAYLHKWTKGDRSKPSSAAPKTNHNTSKESNNNPPPPRLEELSKLDDLADCLLQGMAWIEWENNRARVAASKDLASMSSVLRLP